MNREVKIYLSFFILIGYLLGLSILIAFFTTNVYVMIAEVIAGTIGFTALTAILVEYVPIMKIFFSNILAIFESIKTTAKIQVRYRIEGIVNDFRDKMDKEVIGILPYPLKLHWLKTENEVQPFIDQDKMTVVVRIKHRDEEDWNIASTTLAYVKAGLVSEAKPHMRESLSYAIDFSFSKKMLEDEGRIKARNYLIQEEITPIIQKNDELRENYENLVIISEELLTRVYLREVSNTAIKSSHIAVSGLNDDYLAFLDWAVHLATRHKTGETPRWVFNGTNFNIAIILVAEENTFIHYGTEPYLRRARERFNDGVDGVYILARGNHIIIAETVSRDIEREKMGLVKVLGTEKRYKIRYQDGIVDAIAILFRPSIAQVLEESRE